MSKQSVTILPPDPRLYQSPSLNIFRLHGWSYRIPRSNHIYPAMASRVSQHHSRRRNSSCSAANYLPAEKENSVHKPCYCRLHATALSTTKAIRHVIADKARIILADGYRRIEQGRKNIGPDIPYKRSCPVQAVHRILNMSAV